MKLADKFAGKPSEFIAYFIAALRSYKKNPDFIFQLGRNYCALKGPDQYISEPAAMYMYVTGDSFNDLIFEMKQTADTYEDFHEFMFAADGLGDGLPYRMFQFFGLENRVVRPDNWWLLMDASWETHIKQLEEYWYKLTEMGL